MKSKSSWSLFDSGWFLDEITPKKPIPTTTPQPLTTAPSSWFQTLLDTEDGESSFVMDDDFSSKCHNLQLAKNSFCLAELSILLSV